MMKDRWGEHYGALQSNEAIKYAGQIVEFCRFLNGPTLARF